MAPPRGKGRPKAAAPPTAAKKRALGLSASDLLRQGLRVAAAPYYQAGRRAAAPRLFVSTDPQLGAESHLFQYLEGD